MANAVREAQVFRYERPEVNRPKGLVLLARTDLFQAMVQMVKKGGENNLHSHSGNDGFWFVLGGRARFYGEGDTLLGELGKHEGILIPRNFKYWFESASSEPLEILHIASFDKALKDERTDYTPPPEFVKRTAEGEVVYTAPIFTAARPQGAGAGAAGPPPADSV